MPPDARCRISVLASRIQEKSRLPQSRASAEFALTEQFEPNTNCMTRADETLAVLEKWIAPHPFCRGLSSSHLRRLAECAMAVEYGPGQVILSEGELANRFYLILKGRIALETELRDGTTSIVEVIESGGVLGWSWLFPPFYWTFTARALESTRAVFFYGTRLREQAELDHEFGYHLLKRTAEVVVDRLRATRRRLIEAPLAPEDPR